MKKLASVLAITAFAAAPIGPASVDMARYKQQAANITITRDDWGIAHVRGKTDADAVFGAIYAQAEDDFNRVETNYINAMGRLAEAEGENEIWRDLRMKLFIDPDTLKALYAKSPVWLKSLMNAWADGLNFYLAKHPNVKPRVITKFEPWMALSFTEGSIGGDIEKVSLPQLQAFYGKTGVTPAPSDDDPEANGDNLHPREPSGSNGIAIGPQVTTSHHAMLLINPHTSFYFRSELQMTSDEGLNAYGASTWGQFFIYQGFNANAGWMHTSSSVDATDEFAETVTKKGEHYVYKFGTEERPVIERVITVPYKTPTGMASKKFTVYRTHHGMVTRELNGKWVAFGLMNTPIEALTQSYTRTKSKNMADFRKSMDLHANSSNNTLYADKDGNFAFFHANFIPRRDPKFDWRQPVDGSDPASDWKGLLTFDESPNAVNPPNGWAYNCNNSPWTAAGPNSPKKENFPAYVDPGSESARSAHAIRVLTGKTDFTLEGLRASAYDTYLTYFDPRIADLVKAYDALPATDTNKAKVAEQIELLRKWDLRWSEQSIPTSLAIYWAEDMQRGGGGGAGGGRRGGGGGGGGQRGGGNAAPDGARQVAALAAASARLTADFGTWKTPWGEINRFQRLTDDLVHPFTDNGPSIPVGFPSATWGSLASFGARSFNGSKKIYGTSGNSFVAVVEFGDSVHARAVTAGGESGDPQSKHFNDQAKRYATGNLRDVYFYPTQLKGHTERVYKPGE